MLIKDGFEDLHLMSLRGAMRRGNLVIYQCVTRFLPSVEMTWGVVAMTWRAAEMIGGGGRNYVDGGRNDTESG